MLCAGLDCCCCCVAGPCCSCLGAFGGPGTALFLPGMLLLLTALLLLPAVPLLLETEAAAAVSSGQSSGSYAGAMACNAGAA